MGDPRPCGASGDAWPEQGGLRGRFLSREAFGAFKGVVGNLNGRLRNLATQIRVDGNPYQESGWDFVLAASQVPRV